LDAADRRGAQAAQRLWPRRLHHALSRQPPGDGLHPQRRGRDHSLCRQSFAIGAGGRVDLSAWRGHVPVEMVGLSSFPPIGDQPYSLTLSAYGTFWFLLTRPTQAATRSPAPELLPEFVTLTLRGGGLGRILEGRERRQLEEDVLPGFLQRQRWFGAKDEVIRSARFAEVTHFGDERSLLSIVDVEFAAAAPQRYLVPLAALWGEDNVSFGAAKLAVTLARVRKGPQLGALIDAAYDEGFAETLLEHIRNSREMACPQ